MKPEWEINLSLGQPFPLCTVENTMPPEKHYLDHSQTMQSNLFQDPAILHLLLMAKISWRIKFVWQHVWQGQSRDEAARSEHWGGGGGGWRRPKVDPLAGYCYSCHFPNPSICDLFIIERIKVSDSIRDAADKAGNAGILAEADVIHCDSAAECQRLMVAEQTYRADRRTTVIFPQEELESR